MPLGTPFSIIRAAAVIDSLLGTQTDQAPSVAAVLEALAGKLSTTGNGSGLTGLTVSQLSDASANGRSLISAADYAAMRVLLGLVIGTNVLAPNGNGSGLTGLTQSQITNLVSDLAGKLSTTGNGSGLTGLTVSQLSDASANGRSLISAANYAAMLTLLGAASSADAPARCTTILGTGTNYNGSSDAFFDFVTLTVPSTGCWQVRVQVNSLFTGTGITFQSRMEMGTAVISGSTGHLAGFATTQGASGVSYATITTGTPTRVGGFFKSSGSLQNGGFCDYILDVTTAGTIKLQLAIAGSTSNVALVHKGSGITGVKLA